MFPPSCCCSWFCIHIFPHPKWEKVNNTLFELHLDHPHSVHSSTQLTQSHSGLWMSGRHFCRPFNAECQGRLLAFPDPCGEQWYLCPVHLTLRVQLWGDADLWTSLTLNPSPWVALGFVLCPLHPRGEWKPKLEFIWVANVELMKTSFVYTSGFPLSFSFLASYYSLLSWKFITHLERFFFLGIFSCFSAGGSVRASTSPDWKQKLAKFIF